MISYRGHQGIKDPRDEKRMFDQRAWVAFLVVCLLLSALLSRYIWLQVYAHDDFSTRSENNRVSVRPVVPNRGLIYDRRGRVVAENVPAYRLEIIPEKVADLHTLLERLTPLVDLDEDDIERFEGSRRQFRVFDGVPIKLDLSEQQVARFAVNQHLFEGVYIKPYLSRHYPYGDLLTHVIGYVGRMDAEDVASVDAGNYRGTSVIGKIGVEQYHETALHGTSGFERVETNVSGRVLQVLERLDAIPGDDLVLSIDVAVQQVAWDAIGERPGSVVAIDPTDGSVIAMVSKPAYDPNAFVHGISHKAYQDILNAPGRPLFNRALRGGYEPGSTLKPFVGLAGLEAGLVNEETRVFSNGKFYIEGYSRPYRDWKPGGHGWVTMTSALEQSVNTYFYQLASDLGIDRMHDYLAQFGFGEASGIDVPGEGKGILPSRQWKRAVHNQPWYPGETVIAGIGQGFNVVTPVQLANAISTLINGGTRYEPRLLYATKVAGNERAEHIEAPIAEQVPVVNPRDWEVIREGMDRVINGPRGSARAIAKGAHYRMAGKSGTAQVVQLAQNEQFLAPDVAQHLRNHALFVAFAPVDDPKIAVAVVLEHGGGGSTDAAPVAKQIIEAWLDQEIGAPVIATAGEQP